MILNELEHYLSISMPVLKKRGFLQGFKRGCYNFMDYKTGRTTWISIEVTVNPPESEEDNHIRLMYTYNFSNSPEQYDYYIPLVTTECRYGGVRFWFRCTHRKKDGERCYNRVGVLYLKNGLFACRKCHELVYESTNLSGADKKAGHIIPMGKVEELRRDVKRSYYAKKRTRKYLRYLKVKKHTEDAIMASLGKSYAQAQKFLEEYGHLASA